MTGAPMSWIVSSLAVLALAACVAAPRPGVPLTGVQWRLTELEGAPVAGSSVPRAPALRFVSEGERVTGFTTCNSLFGRYDAPGGDRLRLGELGTTRMACVDPALAAQEQRFLSVLERVDRFTIAGDTLILRQGDVVLARLTAAQGG
jgi:heat shock protein HslJ